MYTDAALKTIEQLNGYGHVQFIILFGSAGENRMTGESDIDLCLYYDGDPADAAQFRHAILSALPGTRYDVQVFQSLPLYVRVEVLKGTPLFVRDPVFLYEKAVETLRDFDNFKHRLYDYTGQAAMP
ncbi:MAG: nucleotidyltransferase domain-containing protein [Methanoregula sp.]|uniref:nucleotidyltransferase domain-containing protein n=1 Tax=Methanoregula sp. TaxID=2052170 RepID=UPI0025CFB056|nr:nucleotidyltransferase domain-containing protein [Methanoregula sp.]MCK9632661.1 nucleotidyltransferase domain-containing protein [Methanoregula sp.]